MRFAGKDYEALIGSDVYRDGMYLEVREQDGLDIAEVFYADADGSMVLTTFGRPVPLPLVEWMIGVAKERLPPMRPEPN